MPIVPEKNSTSPIILIAIIVFGAAAGYFYYTKVSQDQVPQVAPLNIAPGDGLAEFKNLKFDFGPFDDFKFKSLRIFGESPVQPGVTGRADIFAPF